MPYVEKPFELRDAPQRKKVWEQRTTFSISIKNYPVNIQKTMENPPSLIGTSTISMGNFNSELLVDQRVESDGAEFFFM